MFKLSYSTNGLTKLDFFRAISEVEKAGFEGVELSFQYGQFDPFTMTDEHLLKIKNFFKNRKVKPICISTATPRLLSDIPHEPSLISLDADKRRQRIELIQKGIEIAQKVDIPIVSFQSGYLRKEHIDNPSINPRKLLVEGIKDCLADIGDVILVIEPEPGMYIETLNDAISLMDEVNSPNFRLHVDIGHVYCTEDDYIKSIVEAIPYTEYMHLADIKEGYNLKLICLPSYSLEPSKIDLDFAGYLIYISSGNDFLFIDKEKCICFYSNELNHGERENIRSFAHALNGSAGVKFVNLENVHGITSDKEIDLEVNAFLDSVAGIDFEVIRKSEPILKFLRNKQEANNEPIITKPICNTIKGKVHYHEFPGKGEIDFNATLRALKDNNYNGYVTVELYNHSDVWESVLSASREYLLKCMEHNGEELIDLTKEGWNPQALGEIDHRIVKAPYIRLTEYKKGKQGDYVFLYDLRFTQPNTSYIKAEVLHSLEHFLLTGFKRYMDGFVSMAPMGCQTGFYLILLNECSAQKIIACFEKVLEDILLADEVPLSSDKECGQASYHDLEGAKQIAKQLLKDKHKWLEVC
ncbi:S-ribosylhomocysteine lyase LuxS involved in autoinducer biosynthesis/sugar phosphate isomerase/epimerase [Desulfohalotomaculum tongense]|uniref:S-ribosylhomocysteine lyase n=1 Tax=Desulforadius tongensis TaxID=1216062 RepID=UPI001957E3AC|nr:S-ribosylhomocysteine lyase [Desulforadius tongensis]MBM7854991.1 S-ribosylhomocysteine lyase LuxS involved in autoinducer biosynthesis/sugar phosphate isomerase/epimerase [Desulforadius tongensis]